MPRSNEALQRGPVSASKSSPAVGGRGGKGQVPKTFLSCGKVATARNEVIRGRAGWRTSSKPTKARFRRIGRVSNPGCSTAFTWLAALGFGGRQGVLRAGGQSSKVRRPYLTSIAQSSNENHARLFAYLEKKSPRRWFTITVNTTRGKCTSRWLFFQGYYHLEN